MNDFLFLFKSHDEKQLQERIEKILNILSGEITIGVHMQFLIKNNHADLLILKQIKVRITKLFFIRIEFLSNRMLYVIQYVIQRRLLPTAICYPVQPVINFFGMMR